MNTDHIPTISQSHPDGALTIREIALCAILVTLFVFSTAVFIAIVWWSMHVIGQLIEQVAAFDASFYSISAVLIQFILSITAIAVVSGLLVSIVLVSNELWNQLGIDKEVKSVDHKLDS